MNETSAPQPGLVAGIVSCVCAAFGFVIPGLGLIFAIVGLVAGIRGYRAAKGAGYQAGIILGLIGSLISGICLAVAAIAVLALIGGAGLLLSQ